MKHEGMSDRQPERIWYDESIGSTYDWDMPGKSGTEYVRADLYEAQKEAADEGWARYEAERGKVERLEREKKVRGE